MVRLSLPVERMRAHYDAVVVGSGYGGGVAASRIARCGKTVAVLERGREFLPGEFPDTAAEAAREFQITAPDLHTGPETGLYDFHLHEGVSVFVGCGLGGTSLLNASVALRAEPRVFEDARWPSALPDATGMAPYYDLAEAMLEPVPYPETAPRLGKLEALAESARRLGTPFYRPPINVTFTDRVNHAGVEQGACRLCGDCVSGCNYGAKNTTVMNYLPDAVAHGAEIFTCVMVTRVERKDGRWIVHYRLPDTGRGVFGATELFVTADVVVLAAGTLGSSEILLRSRAHGLPLSDRLGHRFTGNGDVLAFGYDSAVEIGGIGFGQRDPQGRTPVGPCITGIIDVRDQPELRDGMVIEEGSIPGALGTLLPEALAVVGRGGVDTASGPGSLLRQREREVESLLLGPYHGAIANTQTYLVMTHDDDAGRIELSGDDRAVVIWERAGDERIFHRVDHHLREATTAIEGIHVRDPLWSKLAGNSLVTVHPLGGSIMGEDAAGGVVNDRHQPFSGTAGTEVHDGLYVADGSVVPVPLGVNPLLTITALAERAIALLAADRGWTIDYASTGRTLPPAPPVVPGIEFSERMSGWFSAEGGDDFEAAAQRGRETDSSFSFTLTIASPDVDRMLADPDHTAAMAGTVIAPALSAQPLAVSDGQFNLFVQDPQHPGSRLMRYRMRLSSEEGRELYFEGYKLMERGQWTRLWPQTTTLYITLHEGVDATAPVLGRGVLTIAPADFARQLTTMRSPGATTTGQRLDALARFGLEFAGTLFHVYGGVEINPTASSAQAVAGQTGKRRDLRLPAPESHSLQASDGAGILLTRYPGGDRGPVLLVPDAAQAGRVFSLHTVAVTLAEFLAAHGFEPWLLDHRGSPLTPASGDHTLDSLARDVRAALEHVRTTTRASAALVGHGLGATVSLMAILAGEQGVRTVVCSGGGLHFAPESVGGAPSPPRNLNSDTRAALPNLRGTLPAACQEQIARCRTAGTVVDGTGADVYMPHLDRLDCPVALIGGADDDPARVAGSLATFNALRILPGRRGRYARQLIRGYALDDCLVGDSAAKEVFPWVVQHLEP